MDNRSCPARHPKSLVRFFLALLLFVPSIFFAQGANGRESRTSFENGGRKIAVEIFKPVTPGRHPAILVFHGAGGMLLDGPAVHRFARALAENDFAAFVVHYFDRTGTIFARDPSIHKYFDTWRSTVNDAVSFVAGRPDIDPHAIGCFGYSLGAYLSLAQAAHDRRIEAVAELAGAADKKHTGTVQRLPPILIMHGDRDQRVPVKNAYNLEKILKRLDVPYEMKIYRGEGHVLSAASQADAAARAVRFFQQHLKASAAR